ncbi:hypothetical protein NPIL_679831 [Nephila pilipes]|uniref:Uncharacterized protein n=1 Tax=Nephila pilipes TaxID=299642 RepID=A0A8X6PWB8_NEPPI|nr:hypothetical protein NPIL_679831 [Nephila pilipes]
MVLNRTGSKNENRSINSFLPISMDLFQMDENVHRGVPRRNWPFLSRKGFSVRFSGETNELGPCSDSRLESVEGARSPPISSKSRQGSPEGLCDPVEFEGIGKGKGPNAERRGLRLVPPPPGRWSSFCFDLNLNIRRFSRFRKGLSSTSLP